MKKLVLLSAMAISGLIHNNAKAQFSVHVGVNLFPHRVLAAPRVDVDAPVYTDVNYDNNDDYYYLPDVNAYYNVDEQCYYYFDGYNWIAANYLPGEYHDYDWRAARRYEIREARPYLHNDVYFNRFRGNGDVAFHKEQFRGGPECFQPRGPQQFADNNRGGQFGFGDRRDDHFNDRGTNNYDHNNGWNYDRGGQQPNRWNNDRGQQQQGQQQQQDQDRGWGNNRGQQNNQQGMNHGWGNNSGQQQGRGGQPSAPNQRGNDGGQQNNHGGNGGQYAPAQNHNDGNRGGQQRIAANNNGFGGHNAGGHF